MGNEMLTYTKQSQLDKKEMITFIQWDNLMRKPMRLSKCVNDGTLSEMFGLWDKYGLTYWQINYPKCYQATKWDKMGEDFKALQTILGKELIFLYEGNIRCYSCRCKSRSFNETNPKSWWWSSWYILSSWNSYKDTMNDAKVICKSILIYWYANCC